MSMPASGCCTTSFTNCLELEPCTTDSYKELIRRLSTEWRGMALKSILKNNKYKMSELTQIESNIDAALQNLIIKSKNKHGIRSETEIVYSISSLYLVDTKD